MQQARACLLAVWGARGREAVRPSGIAGRGSAVRAPVSQCVGENAFPVPRPLVPVRVSTRTLGSKTHRLPIRCSPSVRQTGAREKLRGAAAIPTRWRPTPVPRSSATSSVPHGAAALRDVLHHDDPPMRSAPPGHQGTAALALAKTWKPSGGRSADGIPRTGARNWSSSRTPSTMIAVRSRTPQSSDRDDPPLPSGRSMTCS
jgi:hypothetical protein